MDVAEFPKAEQRKNRIHCDWIKTTEIKVNITQITVGNTIVNSTDSVMNLGVIVDENHSMDTHIAKVSRAVCVSIRTIGTFCKHQPVAELLTHPLITSRLEPCKSLLHGLNETQLKRLQRLQNTAARLVTLSMKFTHMTPILKQLHWLPIEQRIIFKMFMFVFKTIHGVSPTYLCSLVKPYEPHRGNMRSANKLLLP